MGKENTYKYYSIDESLLSHNKNGYKLWDIGAIEIGKNSNNNINFRLVINKNRDGPTLRTLISNPKSPFKNYLNLKKLYNI